MRMTFVFLFFLLILLPRIVHGGYSTEIVYGNSHIYYVDILSTSDPFYYVIGWMNSPNSQGLSGDDTFVTKISGDGETILWICFFGWTSTSESDRGNFGAFTTDGNLVVFGSRGIGADASLTKINVGNGAIIYSVGVGNYVRSVGGVAVDSSTGTIFTACTQNIASGYTYFFPFTNANPPVMSNARYQGNERVSEDCRAITGGALTSSTSTTPRGSFTDIVLEKWNYGMGLIYGVFIGFDISISSRIRSMEVTGAGEKIVTIAKYGLNCIVLIKLDPSPAIIFDYSVKYCVTDISEELYPFDLLEFDSYYVVSGLYIDSSSSKHGFIFRVSKTDGMILKAEYVKGVEGFYGLSSSNNAGNGDIMGVGYRLVDGFYRGVLMRFQNDGNGCDLENMESKILNSTISITSSGSHIIGFSGPGGWAVKTHDFTKNPDPALITKQCTRQCFGESIINGDDSSTCSGHGVCQDWDDCFCNGLYPGQKCEQWSCWGIPNTETDKFCGNNQTGFFVGFCVDIDTCFCVPGYSADVVNKECINWMCGKFDKEDSDVCEGRGDCIQSQECDCLNDFEGTFCETWSCGADYKEKSTCSGHGKCKSPNTCECKTGFTGTLCETNMMYYTVMAPVLSSFGVSTAIVILCLVLCVLCICCCLIFVFYCGICGVGCLGCVVSIQKARMKKFGKLKNIDILLKEQEMESDESVAHLRITKNMFEISYDEIHLESIIGEGGSSSVVYKASWKKQTIAFKCFKTRQVCGDQQSFDEFEAEIKVMSSISHPNIIRFFGGSLQPPRVGIVMEYCEKGDLVIFLKNYTRVNDGELYPLEEKVRAMHEIASAMEYLHSRKILHRDLKLENVLVDSNECCKLMDFGLSKIVERVSRAQTKQIGTNIYMSPEIVKSGHYDEKTDVFSFGILMFILITQNWNPYGVDERLVEVRVSQDPTYRPNIEEVEKMIKSGDIWMKKLMMCCWDDQSKVRKSFSDILEIIEERTVVEDAVLDFEQNEGNNRESVTVRSTAGGNRNRKGRNDAGEWEEKFDLVSLQNKQLKKKDKIMRRQLFIVQKEKERLQRILRKSNIDFENRSAPQAPTRESKKGVKAEIKKEINDARKNSSLKILYKMAPKPPNQQNQKQKQRLSKPTNIPGRKPGKPRKKPPSVPSSRRNPLIDEVDRRLMMNNNRNQPPTSGKINNNSNPTIKKNVLFNKRRHGSSLSGRAPPPPSSKDGRPSSMASSPRRRGVPPPNVPSRY